MENVKIIDRSDWVASLCSVNGDLNGTPGSYNMDMDEVKLKCSFYSEGGGFWSNLCLRAHQLFYFFEVMTSKGMGGNESNHKIVDSHKITD